jgi:hypothetical protein
MKLGFLTLAAVAYGARTPESQLASVKDQVTELLQSFSEFGSSKNKIAKKKKDQIEKTMDKLSEMVKKCTMEEVELPADEAERSTDPCQAAGQIKRKISSKLVIIFVLFTSKMWPRPTLLTVNRPCLRESSQK